MTKKNFFKKLAFALSFSILIPLTNGIKAFAEVKEVNIQAQSAIVVDYNTGEIIYAKDAQTKRYPASTTKLMTALLLAEHKQKTDNLTYTEVAKIQPAYSFNTNYLPIAVGTQIQADVAMKGLLLYSANDIAYMVADNIAGSAEAFEKMMNDKASELGMKDTHFITPNGLHNDNHYTTAYDLTILMKAAFENEWVRETLETKDYKVVIGDKWFPIENRNKDLGINGNLGGKTGYTNEAGGAFASVFERDGRKLIGTVLKTSRVDNEDRTMFDDTNKIMDSAYSATKDTYKKSGESLGEIELSYKVFKFFGPTKTIKTNLILAEDLEYYKNTLNDKEGKITTPELTKDAWSLALNSDLNAKYSVLNYSTDVKAKVDLSFTDLLKANIGFYLVSLVVLIIVVVLIAFTIKVMSNSTRQRRKRR